MTDYPVQCYNNNGEPYGRYVTHVNGLNESCQSFREDCRIDGYLCRQEDDCFCKQSEGYQFPFPSGTIGKTYEKDEVEVVWQAWDCTDCEWFYCNFGHEDLRGMDTRKIFRLIPQLVEKEPETVEQAANRLNPYFITSHSYDKWNEGFIAAIDWQKKQEASK